MPLEPNPALLPGYDAEPSPEQIEEYRQRLRKMSDVELMREGKAAAFLCSPKQNFGRAPRKVFVAHLQEARAEWRWGHPKTE